MTDEGSELSFEDDDVINVSPDKKTKDFALNVTEHELPQTDPHLTVDKGAFGDFVVENYKFLMHE
jgi:hypothetical protein